MNNELRSRRRQILEELINSGRLILSGEYLEDVSEDIRVIGAR